MIPKTFIVFDVWGDYAHFKRYYTTASPLTFAIPPRTAIVGLISAILGLGKALFGSKEDEYLSHMTKDQACIALQLLHPVKKVRLGMNLINTKDGYWVPVKRGFHEPRTQIRFEFLKDPKFRIYFSHRERKLYETLRQYLKEHKSVYTPYLGISELIANFEYIGEFVVARRPQEDEVIAVKTVLPLDVAVLDPKKLLEPGYKFFKERIPTEMRPGRVVTKYCEVLYEGEGKPIYAKVKEGFILEDEECIVPL